MHPKRNVQCIFSGTVLLSAIFIEMSAAAGGSHWSSWYNSDSPYGEGDNETVERISWMFGLPCREEDIASVQCRRSSSRGHNGTFSNQLVYYGNVLRVPCNRSGLLCRNEDQWWPGSLSSFTSSSSMAPVTMCADYEIRLLCWEKDTNESNTNPPNPPRKDNITSHAAFIAVIACGSVVLPLVTVLVFRFRKSKQARLQRQLEQQQNPQGSSEEGESEEERRRRADAPPAYDLLFANPEPVSTISAETSQHIGGVQNVPGGGIVGSRSTERLVQNHVTGSRHVQQGEVNHGLDPVELSASEEPSALTERPTTTAVSSDSPDRAATSRSSSALSSDSNINNTTTTSPTRLPAIPSDSGLRRVSSESSTSSATSTRPLLTPTGRGVSNDVTHNDPPPAYDWPGHAVPSHVTVVMPAGTDSDAVSTNTTSSEESTNSSNVSDNRPPAVTPAQPAPSNRLAQRRFTGMHLSIFDLMSVIYPDSDPIATPPPTYDDALKILEASEQPEIRMQ